MIPPCALNGLQDMIGAGVGSSPESCPFPFFLFVCASASRGSTHHRFFLLDWSETRTHRLHLLVRTRRLWILVHVLIYNTPIVESKPGMAGVPQAVSCDGSSSFIGFTNEHGMALSHMESMAGLHWVEQIYFVYASFFFSLCMAAVLLGYLNYKRLRG